MTMFEQLWKDNNSEGVRLLHFVTEGYDAEKAKTLVCQVGQYNAFFPERVCEAIDRCPLGCGFQIGREGSPVIYVQLPVSTTRERDKEEVIEAFRSARPDEMPPTEGNHSNSFTLRFWWD